MRDAGVKELWNLLPLLGEVVGHVVGEVWGSRGHERPSSEAIMVRSGLL